MTRRLRHDKDFKSPVSLEEASAPLNDLIRSDPPSHEEIGDNIVDPECQKVIMMTAGTMSVIHWDGHPEIKDKDVLCSLSDLIMDFDGPYEKASLTDNLAKGIKAMLVDRIKKGQPKITRTDLHEGLKKALNMVIDLQSANTEWSELEGSDTDDHEDDENEQQRAEEGAMTDNDGSEIKVVSCKIGSPLDDRCFLKWMRQQLVKCGHIEREEDPTDLYIA